MLSDDEIFEGVRNKEFITDDRVVVIRDLQLNTPLHFMALYHNVLHHGQLSNIVNMLGETPLHWMASRNLLAIQHNDIASVKDKFGNSPLHWAASVFGERVLWHPDLKRTLNSKGLTPFDYIEFKPCSYIAQE